MKKLPTMSRLLRMWPIVVLLSKSRFNCKTSAYRRLNFSQKAWVFSNTEIWLKRYPTNCTSIIEIRKISIICVLKFLSENIWLFWQADRNLLSFAQIIKYVKINLRTITKISPLCVASLSLKVGKSNIGPCPTVSPHP